MIVAFCSAKVASSILRAPHRTPCAGVLIHPKRKSRCAISLLEVVLALSILGVATAYLAQSMQLAAQNAIRAQRLTQAELVIESIMNQVIAGVIPAQPGGWVQYTTTTTNGNWNYMLTTVQAEMQGMIGVQVSVQEAVAGAVAGQQVPDLVATRWIIDPALELDVPPQAEATDATGSGQSGQSAGAGQASGTGGLQ
jgi:type II secretory pathway pseudopilin PulG